MTPTLPPQEIQALDNLQPGDIVEHPKWGIGSIIQRSGQGEHTKLIVAFPEADGNGQKKLLAKVARLKKIEDKPVASPEPVEGAVVEEEKKPRSAEGAEEAEEEDDDDDDDTLLPVEVDDDDDEEEELSKSAKNAKDDDWENETED
jgi:hypothetical protein